MGWFCYILISHESHRKYDQLGAALFCLGIVQQPFRQSHDLNRIRAAFFSIRANFTKHTDIAREAGNTKMTGMLTTSRSLGAKEAAAFLNPFAPYLRDPSKTHCAVAATE